MRQRLQKIDLARTAALIGMVIYHFCWDLSFFGYIPGQMPQSSGFILLARSVAGSFLFLAGFSLFLAQGAIFHKAAFIRRFAVIALCAAAVSAATWFFAPQDFIYFGILHAIACAALVGLLFLHTPLLLNCAAIIFCFYLPWTGIDLPYPALWWLGLSSSAAQSFDYVPFFPWFACALAGQTAAAFMTRHSLLAVLQDGIRPVLLNRFLQFPGRHSLAFYLIHQPVLIGGLYVFSCIMPPDYNFARDTILKTCVESCLLQNTEQLCRAFCACSVDGLAQDKLLASYARGQVISAEGAYIAALRARCAAQAFAPPQGAAE